MATPEMILESELVVAQWRSQKICLYEEMNHMQSARTKF
jgi:hypothetical protein